MLCGRPNKPHYASCPPDRLSVSYELVVLTKIVLKLAKTLPETGNRCINF